MIRRTFLALLGLLPFGLGRKAMGNEVTATVFPDGETLKPIMGVKGRLGYEMDWIRAFAPIYGLKNFPVQPELGDWLEVRFDCDAGATFYDMDCEHGTAYLLKCDRLAFNRGWFAHKSDRTWFEMQLWREDEETVCIGYIRFYTLKEGANSFAAGFFPNDQQPFESIDDATGEWASGGNFAQWPNFQYALSKLHFTKSP